LKKSPRGFLSSPARKSASQIGLQTARAFPLRVRGPLKTSRQRRSTIFSTVSEYNGRSSIVPDLRACVISECFRRCLSEHFQTIYLIQASRRWAGLLRRTECFLFVIIEYFLETADICYGRAICRARPFNHRPEANGYAR
jgi:hypothetical protein